jgi:hypothetical protein
MCGFCPCLPLLWRLLWAGLTAAIWSKVEGAYFKMLRTWWYVCKSLVAMLLKEKTSVQSMKTSEGIRDGMMSEVCDPGHGAQLVHKNGSSLRCSKWFCACLDCLQAGYLCLQLCDIVWRTCTCAWSAVCHRCNCLDCKASCTKRKSLKDVFLRIYLHCSVTHDCTWVISLDSENNEGVNAGGNEWIMRSNSVT